MSSDKVFLSYNQQMKKLRNNKGIQCDGSSDKKLLIRSGYFNMVNGYKTPFTNGFDSSGNHIYIPGTSIKQLHAVKQFDDRLRSFILRYITQVETEVRTLTGYKFDDINNQGHIPWYDTYAYDPNASLQNKMTVISKAYKEISDSHVDYVKFYMDNHTQIPTWIMLKAINFSTFIDVLRFSKKDVSHSLCKLYAMLDQNGLPSVKLLIGSLHWMRRVRNACAHNERVYCLSRAKDHSGHGGRIKENYIRALRPSYSRDLDQRIFDLIVYFKYYLPSSEYKQLIKELKDMLLDLQSKIHPSAFDYIRGQMGLKDTHDLDSLLNLPKDPIEYNRFDR